MTGATTATAASTTAGHRVAAARRSFQPRRLWGWLTHRTEPTAIVGQAETQIPAHREHDHIGREAEAGECRPGIRSRRGRRVLAQTQQCPSMPTSTSPGSRAASTSRRSSTAPPDRERFPGAPPDALPDGRRSAVGQPAIVVAEDLCSLLPQPPSPWTAPNGTQPRLPAWKAKHAACRGQGRSVGPVPKDRSEAEALTPTLSRPLPTRTRTPSPCATRLRVLRVARRHHIHVGRPRCAPTRFNTSSAWRTMTPSKLADPI